MKKIKILKQKLYKNRIFSFPETRHFPQQNHAAIPTDGNKIYRLNGTFHSSIDREGVQQGKVGTEKVSLLFLVYLIQDTIISIIVLIFSFMAQIAFKRSIYPYQTMYFTLMLEILIYEDLCLAK